MIENIILGNLLVDREYAIKVVPYLEHSYFDDIGQQVVCKLITSFIKKYNNLPKPEALLADLENRNLSDNIYEAAQNVFSSLVLEHQDQNWLLDETESFCHKRAVHNAVLKVVEQIDKGEEHGIDQILRDALAVSFDSKIGHDFFNDNEERWDHYQEERITIPFDIDILNKITDGGLPRKTLTAFLAPTGVGKSLIMCHNAAAHISAGYNVLYITLEMSEYKISRRIEANLYGMDIKDFQNVDKPLLERKLNRIKNKSHGELIVKEYPTGSAHAGHFRHTINEMKLKKGFTPDVIYIDYLGICASSRKSGNSGMYELYKSVAEELRALAIEFNTVCITGLQVNREGIKTNDPAMTDVAESMGILHALDLLLGVVNSEIENQLLFTQLKNRDGDINYYKNFFVGVDRSKMKLYDVDSVQENNTVIKKEDRKSKIMSVFGDD